MPRFRYLLLAAVVAYLLTGVAQIRPEERGVVRRFGDVVAHPGPGLWVGFPWGIDQLDRVRVRTVRQLDVGYPPQSEDASSAAGQLLTGDQNLVNVKLVVEYAVSERDGELDDYVRNRDVADAILARETEALAAEWVAGRPVDEVLLAGRASLPRWLGEHLPARLAPHALGVVVQRVTVATLSAPDKVRDAFEAVNQAQTAIRTRGYQAMQEGEQRTREAEATKFRFEQQAEAYRRERVSFATAEAEAFTKRSEQYRKLRQTNPDILAAIWWDEMGRLLLGMKGRGRVELLDAHIGPNGLDITQFLPPKKR